MEALVQADQQLHMANSHITTIEEEWSEKMGEYIRINAQLRVENKQAMRKATALEAELAKSKERIASLEQALTDVALDSSYSAATSRALETISTSTPVASLGEGHGGVALNLSPTGVAGGPASVSSLLASPPPSASASEEPSAVDGEAMIDRLPHLALTPGKPPRAESPARLSRDESRGEDLTAEPATSVKGGSCCLIS